MSIKWSTIWNTFEKFMIITGILGIGYSAYDIVSKLNSKTYTSEQIYNKIDDSNAEFLNSLKLLLVDGEKEKSTIVVNPINPTIWNVTNGNLKWYNPPLAFVIDEVKDTDISRFRKGSINYNIIFFNSYPCKLDEQLKKRLKRAQIFIKQKFQTEYDNSVLLKNNDRLNIKILTKASMPPLSFFLGTIESEKINSSKKLKSSIIYLGKEEKPNTCLLSYSNDIFITLNSQFEIDWNQSLAKEIDIKKLMQSNLDTISCISCLCKN